ncbi:hypothetical protein FRC08_000901 [Ceratobasidium sp. 394]|nr:hypothetical protein FRC08_000901 [Ceratobasidium sp. 394]
MAGMRLLLTASTSDEGPYSSEEQAPETSIQPPQETSIEPPPDTSIPAPETSTPAPETSTLAVPDTSSLVPETSSKETTTSISTITSPPSSAPTSLSSQESPTPSATDPSLGTQTCAQRCLAAVATTPCSGLSGYLRDVESCFVTESCPLSLVSDAARDYSLNCQSSSMLSGSTITTGTPPGSTVTVIETAVIHSIAVTTVSGETYIVTSALTTRFSGQPSDSTGGAGVSTIGASSASGTALPNLEVSPLASSQAFLITAVTLVVGLLVGGFTCLAF